MFNQFRCPVCGYDLNERVSEFLICVCCGCEFGNDDFTNSYEELRALWIEKGMRWFSQSTSPPNDWNPVNQLEELNSTGPKAQIQLLNKTSMRLGE